MSESSNRTAARRLDVGGQVLCILMPLLYWLSVRDEGLEGALSFILIYLALGAWQAVSCVVWRIKTPWRAVSAGRKFYLLMLGVLATMLLPNLAHSGSSFERAVGITLVGTALLGIYYFVLSILEGRHVRRIGGAAFRSLKIFDAAGQVCAFLFVLSIFIPDAQALLPLHRINFFASSTVVQAWYLVSVAAWGVGTPRAAKPYLRRVLEKVFLILVGLGVIGSLLPMMFVSFQALGYMTPLAAVAYAVLTIVEAVHGRQVSTDDFPVKNIDALQAE